MSAGQPVLEVVGADPGIGASVARRFGGQGYAVGLIARNRKRLEPSSPNARCGIGTAWLVRG